MCGNSGPFRGREVGHGNFLGKKFDCTSNSFFGGSGDVDAIAPIVLHRRTDLPSFTSVGGPGSSLVGHFVDDSFGAEWGQGCAIEIKWPLEVTIC